MGRFFRRMVVPLVLLSVAVGGGLLFKQFRAALTILALFPRWAIAAILASILLAEVVKIARWRFFVCAAGTPMRWRDAATSLLAGQTASILHGGDLLRIRLAAEHGIAPRTGIAVSFAMWATDIMTLPFLALAGYGKHLVARWLLFLPLIIPVVLILIARSRRFARLASRGLRRFRLTRRYALSEGAIEHVTALLTRPTTLAGGLLYALVMRLLFAATLLCIVNVLSDAPLRYRTVLSAHALSTLAGAFSFLPGFLAIGSMVELLNARGVPRLLGFLITLTNRLIGITVNLTLGPLILVLRYPRAMFGGGKQADTSAADAEADPTITGAAHIMLQQPAIPGGERRTLAERTGSG